MLHSPNHHRPCGTVWAGVDGGLHVGIGVDPGQEIVGKRLPAGRELRERPLLRAREVGPPHLGRVAVTGLPPVVESDGGERESEPMHRGPHYLGPVDAGFSGGSLIGTSKSSTFRPAVTVVRSGVVPAAA